MVDNNGNFASLLAWALFAVVVTVVAITTIPQETWHNIGETIGTVAQTVTNAVFSVITGITTKKETKTATQTKTSTKTKTKEKEQANYWEAIYVPLIKDIVIGKLISAEEAKNRVDRNQSIMCKNREYAERIAYQFDNVLEPEINVNQRPGKMYYYHFHIHGRHGDPHIWYYGI